MPSQPITTQQLENKLFQGDCLKILPKFPEKSVDMILCDLPYGTTANKWDSVIPFEALWKEYERILKPGGVIALTSQGVFTGQLIMSNQKLFKYKLAWIKSKATNFLNAHKQPLRKFEDVCIFYRTDSRRPTYNPQMGCGKPYRVRARTRRWSGSYGEFNAPEIQNDGQRFPTDVVYFSGASSEGEIFHPTQKPVELGRYLIRTYSNPGDLVLDNAFGSGSFLVAAVLEGRKYTGIELNKDSFQRNQRVDFLKITLRRIQATALGNISD